MLKLLREPWRFRLYTVRILKCSRRHKAEFTLAYLRRKGVIHKAPLHAYHTDTLLHGLEAKAVGVRPISRS